MASPSISLCMIVKDEAEVLPECLSSVVRIVDEMIIVDTGSTDNTVAIAESFGARVIRMPWPDSFALARNRGLEEAAGDWILWLDADEQMDVRQGADLKRVLTRDIIREERIEGIQFQFRNYLDDGLVEKVAKVRLIRNRPEHRFEGSIHEYILPSVQRRDPDYRLGEVDIQVHHYGYLPQYVIRKDKVRRNIALLLKERTDDPGNAIPLFYLGMEYYRIHEPENALEYLRSFLADAPDVPIQMVSTAHKARLLVLQQLHHYMELIQQANESIALFPAYTDLYHLQADGWRELGRPDKAIQALQQALQIGPASGWYASLEGIGSYRTCRELSDLYESIGDVEQARVYRVQARQK
ncbi:glycosyltransferase [Paenibacillus albidus]|uniref:glycosyltransferase family 2 protein n=1 Tax=Paenibacillus albidus TaxID=2041023 RepID=UPI001BE8D4D3|nr:glycosyltransferase family 2 protein [Paenibacillus albidus]MBT2287733.1 glycosyltransferase [Paenibacillus albidus]